MQHESAGPPGPQNLPIELLGNIFRHAHHHDTSIGLTVSRVNKYWRSVALQTPRLWTTIDVTRNLKLLKLYLTRARSVPLDIHILHHPYVRISAAYKEHISSAIHLLGGHPNNWSSLTIVAYRSSWLAFVQKRLGASRKGDIDIDILDVQLGHVTRWSHMRVDKIPYHPRQLRVTGILIRELPSLSSSRLELLHLNELGPVAFSSMMNVLRAAPNLFSLQLHGTTFVTVPEDEEEGSLTLDLPILQTLSIEVLGTDWVNLFARKVSIPRLRKLTLQILESDYSIHEFLENQSKLSPIEELLVLLPSQVTTPDLNTSPAQRWATLFSFLPSLTTLRVTSSEISPEDLQCLIPSASSPSDSIVCPHLHTIHLQDIYTISSSFIEQVVASRMDIPGVSPIRTLVVRRCDSELMDYDALMALEAKGVTTIELEHLDMACAVVTREEEEARSVFGSDGEGSECGLEPDEVDLLKAAKL